MAYRLNNRRSDRNTHSVLVSYAGGAGEVLDVGCASGYLAALLSKAGAIVDGIELDPEAANEARSWCRDVRIGSAEDQSTWAGRENRYDVVMLGDVIEHLVDPAAALRGAKAALRPGGRLVVSIPNVAEWRVRTRLLLGHFDYTQAGIMDRTHLRWFTLNTAQALFREAGLRVERWTGAAGGPTPRALLAIRPQLWAPQFVFDLRPI